MRVWRIALCVLLGLLLPVTSFSAERRLKGQVVLVGEHDELKPAIGVSVSLKETGDRSLTKADGLFRLFLPDAFKVGARVTLSVDKPGWRIQYPLEGEDKVPEDLEKQLITVRLLPVGSKKFWSADRIEKLIRDTAEKAKAQVKVDGRPREIDFSHYIKEWAVQYGFSAQQAKEEIERWVAETEQNQDDLVKLGLAAYARKNFGEASKLLSESAELKARKSQQRAEEADQKARESERLARESVEEFRLAGDASFGNYEFDKALGFYERALQGLSREKTPTLWATVWADIGMAHRELGIRAEGESIHQHLNAAISAHERALEVYTREQLPQDWAATQNSLGHALREQGIRAEGEQGGKLLGEAVDACRRALEVRTREQLPQDWAATQTNLGITLQAQGRQAEGEQRAKLLGEAVEAYRRALEVYTREQLPQLWAGTQKNLALAYMALKNWRGAAAACANVLKVFPDNTSAYQCVAYLNHSKLFSFVDARTLHEQWLQRHPDDSFARADLAETQLTTGQFAEAEATLTRVLAAQQTSFSVATRVLEIAALLAQGKTGTIPGKQEALRTDVAARPEEFKLAWEFEGTRHFIHQDERLAPWRHWLLQLIDAVEAKDRNSILLALDGVRAQFPLPTEDTKKR